VNYFWRVPSAFGDTPDQALDADPTTFAVLKQLSVSRSVALEYENLERLTGILNSYRSANL
jgi:hypothetical protein